MAIFKRKHLRKILDGEKTQTRRRHRRTWKPGRTYSIRDQWYGKSHGHIVITRKFEQRLGDISLEDIRKEGYETFEDFKAAWIEIHGNWNPDETVIAYEFKLAEK